MMEIARPYFGMRLVQKRIDDPKYTDGGFSRVMESLDTMSRRLKIEADQILMNIVSSEPVVYRSTRSSH